MFKFFTSLFLAVIVCFSVSSVASITTDPVISSSASKSVDDIIKQNSEMFLGGENDYCTYYAVGFSQYYMLKTKYPHVTPEEFMKLIDEKDKVSNHTRKLVNHYEDLRKELNSRKIKLSEKGLMSAANVDCVMKEINYE